MIILYKPTINYLRHTGIRCLSTTLHLSKDIQTIDLNFGLIHSNTRSRKDKTSIINSNNLTRIQSLDNRFQILNKSQSKILDLGYVPGNWTTYVRDRMASLHNIEIEKIYKKCHILGFDIMFGSTPIGVSSIQGNIFSKSAHLNIVNHFKEVSWLEYKNSGKSTGNDANDEINPKSYYLREQDEDRISKQIELIESGLNNFRASRRQKLEIMKQRDLLISDYRIDLTLHDICAPTLQEFGFHSNSVSQPYFRYNNNLGLNHSIVNPTKANLDFLDASLLLNCKLLKPGGKFVARLSAVDPNDEELELTREKLQKVFNSIFEINNFATNDDKLLVQSFEKYFICDSKKEDHEYDVYDIFKH